MIHKKTDILIWWANVPNHLPKLVNDIKKSQPHIILVISKLNNKNKYSFMHLIARALKAKANLLVEFKKYTDDTIHGSIIDPLGNNWGKSYYPKIIFELIVARAIKLKSFTRVKSTDVGLRLPSDKFNVFNRKDIHRFIRISKRHGETFHKLIHGVETDRFLGNMSFRCEKGFPSFKIDELIFVSKRNIDKRHLDSTSFVPCLNYIKNNELIYINDNKPSVDTPIQIMLYNSFPNFKYMLHSHCSIEGAPYTTDYIPCGAIEEFYQISDILLYCNNRLGNTLSNARINIRGHGSIVMCSNLDYLENTQWKARI